MPLVLQPVQIKQDNIALILLAVLLAGFAWLASISTGTQGGEDSFMHYLFARYVPQHPQNLLDHWGKPLFTLLATPFAQWGFTGAKIYNCLAGVLSAWFTYKTADRLGMKTALASIILLLFAPMYFLSLNSSLTEITFSLVLIAGFYYIVADRFYVAAIILSFLPFARTEGFILLPIIGLFFIWQKKYVQLLFLGLGVIVYSLIGYFYHYHDILWVFTQNPYAGKTGVYGKSDNFWHFADGYRDIIGDPQKWLFIIGFVSFLFRLNRASKTGIENTDNIFKYWLLIVLCVLAYFMAHSIVWYYGIQGSAGLLRVMAGILPLLALISTRGLEAIYVPFQINKNFRLALVFTILFYVVEYPTIRYDLPVQLGPEETLLYEAGTWYKNSEYKQPDTKVYYFAPTVAIAFEIDPFDPNQRAYLHDAKRSNEVPTGSIIVYDMHFGPNECEFPLEEIQSNPDYELLKHFVPKNPFKTMGNAEYEIYVFRKKETQTGLNR